MTDIKISLAAARVNARLTQDDVSKALRISKKTLGNWENGTAEPSFASLLALANLYGIPVNNIFLPTKST